MKRGLFLDPYHAADLHNEESSYIFMSPEQLAQECAQLRLGWRELDRSKHTYQTPHEYAALAAALIELLPAIKPGDVPSLHACAREALAPLPATQVPRLQGRLRQVEDRLASVPRVLRSPFYAPCCTLAVSPLWNRRMAEMVNGFLYPAWVVPMLLDRHEN